MILQWLTRSHSFYWKPFFLVEDIAVIYFTVFKDRLILISKHLFTVSADQVYYNDNISSDCNWTRTQSHLVHKRTLNHLGKLVFNIFYF